MIRKTTVIELLLSAVQRTTIEWRFFGILLMRETHSHQYE